jgi:hypothetical protein
VRLRIKSYEIACHAAVTSRKQISNVDGMHVNLNRGLIYAHKSGSMQWVICGNCYYKRELFQYNAMLQR